MTDTSELRNLPSVDRVLKNAEIVALIAKYGLELVTYASRSAVDQARERITQGKPPFDFDQVIASVQDITIDIAEPSLKPVINGTGVVLHTNLGRAPLGKKVLEELAPVILGYSNLEFDLDGGGRGKREHHCTKLLSFLTGAQDAVVVNNNAAGVILLLGTLAKDKEVIVSRGELIEIGGSFRIPEIMKAAGAKMVEVGATNKTHLADYENAITPQTALIFKAHKSNYTITGFTEEVSVKDLATLARAKGIPMVYDIGSGLLRKPAGLPIDNEPDVQSSLSDGADLVMFSGDKMLGGPQAGVIAGNRDLVRKLARAPLMRAVRCGKLTITALSTACRSFLTDQKLMAENPAFAMLSCDTAATHARAQNLADLLARNNIVCEVVESAGQVGGGTLPDLKLTSFAVALTFESSGVKKGPTPAEKAYKKLMSLDRPVVGVLREGRLLFDALTLFDHDIPYLVSAITGIVQDPT